MNDITYPKLKESVSTGTNVIYIWKKNSKPCRNQTHVIEKLVEELPDINFSKINIEKKENKALIFKYSISGVPAILIFKDGKMTKQLSGHQDEGQIKYYIN